MSAPKNKPKNARSSYRSVAKATYFRRLRLVHHKHSFKLVHYHHTNYPLLGFIVLLTAVFCIGWTSFAKGDTNGGAYVVQAVVPADALTVPATITYPADGQAFNDQIITVSGACPANSYVKLFRNGVYSGTDLCQASGQWYVQTSLVVGINKLWVRDYNVTNQAGPTSTAVTVVYNPPVTNGGSTTSGSSAASGSSDSAAAGGASSSTGSSPDKNPAAPPLIVSGDFTYQGVYAGQPLTEKITLAGGRGPYAVSIDWGDGSTDLSSHANSGEYSLNHTYSQPGNYQNSYTVKITATDADGQISVLQLITIVTSQQTGSGASNLRLPGSGITGTDTTTGSPYSRFWRLAAPAYGAAVVGLGSFWLGQHRELAFLRQQAVAQHRRRPRQL